MGLPLMDNEPVPLRPLDEVDNEWLISPRSSTGLSSPEPKNSPLHSIFNTSDYERVNLDNGDIGVVDQEETASQSQTMPRSSTESFGTYPGHRGSNNSLRRKPVPMTPKVPSPHSSSDQPTSHSSSNCQGNPAITDGRSSTGRMTFGTALKFNQVFRKLVPRGRTTRGPVTARQNDQNDESESLSNATSLPYPEAKGSRASLSSGMDAESADDNLDDEAFKKKFSQPPSYCHSRHDVKKKWTNWIPMTVLVLSIYSTTMSFFWLILSIVQPRLGFISSRDQLRPSTATLITALIAKTIELSFVTVFISVLGQALSRRSFLKRTLGGMTLAEMTMRDWVLQPGSLIIHSETIPYAAGTILGALTLTATITSMFYTTASEAMISPKLMYSNPKKMELSGPIAASYANVQYLEYTCPDMFGSTPRIPDNDIACLQVQFSGQSHRNLFSFMSTWAEIKENGTAIAKELKERPTGKHSLYENSTMTGAWIETEYANVTANFEKYQRIINNVTMAMPHPGVYAAATAPENKIMQPVDLGDVGEYEIRAGVVSPTINVMCVNMQADELAPLVYTRWPNSNNTQTLVGKQVTGPDDWDKSVPHPLNADGQPEYLNRTVVDTVFRWGPKYERRPPVFKMYPSDHNMVANSTVYDSDAIYILAKSYKIDNYTLCEMRSWVSPFCTTVFRSSGITGTSMTTVCEQPADKYAYHKSCSNGQEWPGPAKDWKAVADVWRLALDLNGGTRNNNATNARQLTQLVLEEPKLQPDLPSIAEAMAVFGGATLVGSSIKTPFRHYWEYKPTQLTHDKADYFNASLRTQQYTSGHVASWQAIFYVVLIFVFVISLICCVLLICTAKHGFVTDFTDPQNLFALAINSPPSAQLAGSCGGGPEKRDLMVPWRVAYAPMANHYFLEEANERPWRGKYAHEVATTARPVGKDANGMSYKRLRLGRVWL